MATSSTIASTSSISTFLRRNGVVHLGATHVKRLQLNQRLISTCRATCSSTVSARASIGEVVVVNDGVVEKGIEEGRALRVGLICGGPSAERGISLNSARSVLDHLQVIFF
ncbi:d-alanine-d-alanine ligase family protein [Trifolium pratense]|uniref:D-alanine-d-alanine ligase family protein n=1 Tax=Trifolium pratense TaxID=57577 RepID=A0A2K3KAY8_TRIPR|nr:d-alanine-d-alanine ligase family protein [Trifolium pratense]